MKTKTAYASSGLYSALMGGIAGRLPFTGQTSVKVSASQTRPPRTTYRISLLLRMSPSRMSKPGGYTRKSANLPGVSEPSEEKRPSVFAASDVAARMT